MTDPFNLDRFVVAQERIYSSVVEELKAGIKMSHWMWFIFPQVESLGRTEIAKRYAIKSLDEAKAYVSHPVLGRRLQECTKLVLAIDGESANDIFGHPDDLKFKSSMTLFLAATPQIDLFQRAIKKILRWASRQVDNRISGGRFLATPRLIPSDMNLCRLPPPPTHLHQYAGPA